MWKTFLIVGCVFWSTGTIAQTRKAYVVRAGEIPMDVLPAEAIYSFPQFKKGMVYFRNGAKSNQQLNYNLALGEMHFLDAKKDTLAIATPETVQYILVDTTFFYFDKHYYEIVSTSGENKLAKRQFLVQSPYTTKPGYDVSTSTSSLSTFSSNDNQGQLLKLQIKKDVEIVKRQLYYISDRFNHFFVADKKAFHKIFPEKKAIIDFYLRDNDINFRNQTDVAKLLNFCTAR